MAEFTGERVIPGRVDVDLLNEHLARYAFAARLARGKRVLDAGCGAGYGSAELAQAALSVVGADRAAEAIDFARAAYRFPNLDFERASCAALPHRAGVFDLVVAFEVIEHLEDWRGFLEEARRVLAPNGQFIVSTPNRLYYTESRGPRGANPFHVHEFDFEEFRAELQSVFPHVSMFLENHVEGVTFQPHEPGCTVEARIDAGEPAPDESHFFVAVCAHRRQVGNPTFVYVPRTANVLRERERHITLLEGELAAKDAWLEKAQADLAEFDRKHQKLLVMFRAQTEELESSNQWAEELNQELAQRGARVAELQEEIEREQQNHLAMFRAQTEDLERSNQWAEELNQELSQRRARVAELQEELAREQENARRMAEGYAAKVASLEEENREKTKWALDTDARLTAEIRTQSERLAHAAEELRGAEKELEERSALARRLQEEAANREALLAVFRASRWVKLGRKVGLGPAV
ncbi:MAG: methyltransferase domain-containing protein [Bryobacteraceae bacterium]